LQQFRPEEIFVVGDVIDEPIAGIIPFPAAKQSGLGNLVGHRLRKNRLNRWRLGRLVYSCLVWWRVFVALLAQVVD
jgi:hypothetical protein